ncbi:DNA topology modulation protein [Bacillus sp. 165]|uniref:DNA topology modulation protein n=1 Tax=Bacillus sp. 165 TaxID=1529117 RepID=UPI001ADBD7D8|nr:DNA topology modulation protein [Bacillus sp. 165]MBO9129900.1 DNA topology modulation protein [Bacillus sp. 165]
MKKILLIGSGGAGKSTLARRLGGILGIQVHHLDALYWKQGWVETPREEFIKQIQPIMEQESWIVDGNYFATMEMRMAAADTIIFLALPRLHCTYRVIKRRIQHHKKIRPDMGAGCKEKLDWDFIKWVWNYPRDQRPHILERLKELEGKKNIIILHSAPEVKQFLSRLQKAEVHLD